MSTGAKMRVYELAREIGLPNKELIAKIRAIGVEVNNHMSSLGFDDVERLKKSLERDRIDNTVTKRLSQTVLRRRSKSVRCATDPEPEAHPTEAEPISTPPKTNGNGRSTAPLSANHSVVPVVATPRTVETTAPEKSPAVKISAPVIVAGPENVKLAGVVAKRSPSKSPDQAAPGVAAPSSTTLDDVADTAQARFQKELDRAREQAAEREKERALESARKRQETDDAPGARAEGRPAVGTVIDLPMTRIKITEKPAGRGAGPAGLRGRFADQGHGGRRTRDVRKKKPLKGTGKQTQITTPAEHKRVIRIEETTTVAELGKAMGIKAQELLKKLWQLGMVGITINAQIDFETANVLASEFGYDVQNVAFKEAEVFEASPDAEGDLLSRAPVITVMGHVDHGKTSLLDYIRKAKVAEGEAGGITQHIGAYRVNAGETHGDMVFLDTPGHAAFTEMRARGAQATDIVVLVCAADDGVMPQTKEAIEHAKAAKVPIIVAVNKSDLPQANPEKVRQQCADHGLIPEEWGGESIYVDVSAHTGHGIDRLLEAISLCAELLELKANPHKPAVGVVIEARLDRARGPMATVLVQEGTLRTGDIVVAGECMGKIRAMLNDQGAPIDIVGPSTPVEILGIDGVPEAGETLNGTVDEKMAKQVVENRRQAKRRRELASTSKVSLENLMERIQEGGAQEELKIVLKADVQGSAEALREALIKQSTEKVLVNVIMAGVGGITESDVNLAKAGGAIIIGFHVRPAGKASKSAEQEGVEIKIYDVIYDAIDEVRAAMAGLLAPIQKEVELGKLEVRDTFTIPKRGVVAGCMVTDGRVTRKSQLRVVRDAVQVYQGKVGSLRRFKDEASEVKEGFECGVMVEGFNDIRVGDVIESYEIVEEAATL